MKQGSLTRSCRPHRLAAAVITSAALAAFAVPFAAAQQGETASPRAQTRPAEQVLAQIGRSAGVIVLTDSTVQARLPVPEVAATAETVEQQIAAMVRLLPAGTTWGKLYVPAPVNGRWNGDLVAEYARVQVRQLGGVPQPAPAGMVEILGRHVPAEKANEYAAALNLKLVYLVTNPRAPSAAMTAANWGQMSPPEREAYARQQAQQILALDPASRQAALRQMMMQAARPEDFIMKMVMSQMPDHERVNLKGSLSGEKERGGRAK
jgi:hypothetical protein